MNRYNFGNVATNGMQTISVAGFTGANWAKGSRQAKLADASSALNNLVDTEGMSPKEAFNAKLEKAQEIGEMKAARLQEELDKFHEENISVDEAMEDSDIGMKVNSPQAEALEKKRKQDLDWYNTWVKGKTKMSNQFKSALKKHLEGEDTDANL